MNYKFPARGLLLLILSSNTGCVRNDTAIAPHSLGHQAASLCKAVESGTMSEDE